MPRKIWKRKTMAVVPAAQDVVLIERKMAAMEKQKHSPTAKNMSEFLRPKWSMVMYFS